MDLNLSRVVQICANERSYLNSEWAAVAVDGVAILGGSNHPTFPRGAAGGPQATLERDGPSPALVVAQVESSGKSRVGDDSSTELR
jgi:hypothetical protein